MAKYEAGKITEQSSIKDQANELNRLMDALDGFNPPETYEKAKLKTGNNVIEVNQAAPLDIEIQGRTLMNLFGNNGNFEVEGTTAGLGKGWYLPNNNALNNLSLSNDSRYGLKSQYIATTGVNRGPAHDVKLVAGRKYIIGYDLKSNHDGTDTYSLQGRFIGDNDADTIRHLSSKRSNDQNFTVERFLFEATGMEKRFWFRFSGNAHDKGVIGFTIDGVCLYELTEDEYTEALTMTNAQLVENYPYVDSVQHVRNPLVKKKGINLVPPFNSLTPTTAYAGEIPNSGSYISERVIIPIKGGQMYTLSGFLVSAQQNLPGGITLATRWRVTENGSDIQQNTLDLSMGYGDWGNGLRVRTNNAPSNANYLVLYFWRSAQYSGDSFKFSSLMLNEGEYIPFQPQNNDYLYLDTVLASTERGRVKDSLYSTNTGYVIRESIAKGITFNGSENWTYRYTGRGLKIYSLNVNNYPSYLQVVGREHFSASYADGGIPLHHPAIANYNDFQDKAEGRSFTLFGATTTGNRLIYISINESEEGANLQEFLSKNPLTVSWQLDTPASREVEVEGAVSLHNGLNNLEISTGTVLGEKVTPVMAQGTDWYINGGSEASKVKFNPRDIVTVYKNGKIDTESWNKIFRSLTSGATVTYGMVYLVHKTKNPDPEAIYTVDYVPLQPEAVSAPTREFSISYPTTMAAAFNKTIEKLTDAEQRQSVLARQIIQLYARTISGGS